MPSMVSAPAALRKKVLLFIITVVCVLAVKLSTLERALLYSPQLSYSARYLCGNNFQHVVIIVLGSMIPSFSFA